ncbi:hypothetical protein L873DRAFT_1788114 [Choiromyces venosus 120613-1]|uniref:Cytochrome b mRNA-processing protein 4 n=1 Tax=Choiromyces venosus 120613-1 TaxID=1336337 RepID=A0A3N4JTU1_9PEZI|nr:hypothetical protein L873DRAFT_1788114 [Choiromyces venosus 120613-1]
MRALAYIKMLVAGTVCCVGGPALVYYVTPDPDELFKRYNPDLQRKTLELREQREKNYSEFLGKLREYSKSDKPIWVVAAEEEKKQRLAEKAERKRVRDELEKQKQEILEEQLGGK